MLHDDGNKISLAFALHAARMVRGYTRLNGSAIASLCKYLRMSQSSGFYRKLRWLSYSSQLAPVPHLPILRVSSAKSARAISCSFYHPNCPGSGLERCETQHFPGARGRSMPPDPSSHINQPVPPPPILCLDPPLDIHKQVLMGSNAPHCLDHIRLQ